MYYHDGDEVGNHVTCLLPWATVRDVWSHLTSNERIVATGDIHSITTGIYSLMWTPLPWP